MEQLFDGMGLALCSFFCCIPTYQRRVGRTGALASSRPIFGSCSFSISCLCDSRSSWDLEHFTANSPSLSVPRWVMGLVNHSLRRLLGGLHGKSCEPNSFSPSLPLGLERKFLGGWESVMEQLVKM